MSTISDASTGKDRDEHRRRQIAPPRRTQLKAGDQPRGRRRVQPARGRRRDQPEAQAVERGAQGHRPKDA
jgi:hypothetical protein